MLIHYMVTVLAALAGRAPPSGAEIVGGGKGGWLGRLVQYHKAAFLNDLQDVDNHIVDIEASVEPAPAGYSDPPGWDEGSVLRLLALVSRSRAPSIKPVKRALRRAFRPTRRYMPYIPPGLNSHDLFPSLAGNIENFIYRDYYTDESSSEEGLDTKERLREWEKSQTTVGLNVTEQEKLAVLVVRNPVEARLPSARISVRLLRKIMEERALAARMVTPSTKRTLTWLPRYNATAAVKKAEETTPAAAKGGDGEDTVTKAAGGGKDDGGGGEATTAGGEPVTGANNGGGGSGGGGGGRIG